MKKCSDNGKCVGCGELTSKCECGALTDRGKKEISNDNLNNYENIDVQPKIEAYDEYKEMEKTIQKGQKAVEEHLKQLRKNKQYEHLEKAIQYLEQKNLFKPEFYENQNSNGTNSEPKNDSSEKLVNISPRVNNWPIQISLIDENDPILDNADLLIASECSAFFYDKFRQRFLGNRVLIMFCPKLDKLFKTFVQKFTNIFKMKNIQSITIVHMEVPCCAAIEKIIKKALKLANKVITLNDYTISTSGEII